jgi:hypothetical protein
VSYLLVLAAGTAFLILVPLAFFSALDEIGFPAIFERVDEVAISFLE